MMVFSLRNYMRNIVTTVKKMDLKQLEDIR